MTYWQRWIRQPQTTWLRKAIFQLHLWSGIGLELSMRKKIATVGFFASRQEDAGADILEKEETPWANN